MSATTNLPLPSNYGKSGKTEKFFFNDLKQTGDSQFYPEESGRSLTHLRAPYAPAIESVASLTNLKSQLVQ